MSTLSMSSPSINIEILLSICINSSGMRGCGENCFAATNALSRIMPEGARCEHSAKVAHRYCDHFHAVFVVSKFVKLFSEMNLQGLVCNYFLIICLTKESERTA